MNRLRNLLREKWKAALVIGVIEVLIIAVAPSPMSADHPYLGGYFANSQCIDTKHVIMDCTIPPGVPVYGTNFLAGVLSVAGAENGNLSGWIYQIATLRDGAGNLDWVTNSWDMGTNVDGYEASLPSSGNWEAIFLRMDMEGTDSYANRCWGYENDLNVLAYYDVDHSATNSGEEYFRVGTSTDSDITFKHLQFGIESEAIVQPYAWKCTERQVGCYDGDAWQYQPTNVAHHDNSFITWRGTGTNWLKIGHSDYDGVNIDWTGPDAVGWWYEGITVPDDEHIWLSRGQVLASPSVPFKGGIEGYVMNRATGYPLPYSTVTVRKGTQVVQEVETDYDGRYHIFDLDPGTYNVTASHIGLKSKNYTFVQSDVEFRTKTFALDPVGPGPIPYQMRRT